MILVFQKNYQPCNKTMAEAFSYFTYNNNLERSFLSSLSQILQENSEEQQSLNNERKVEEVSQLQIEREEDDDKTVSSDASNTESDSSDGNGNNDKPNDSEEDDSDNDDLYIKLMKTAKPEPKETKHAKVVPLPRQRKQIKFTHPESDAEEEEENIKEVDISESPESNTAELEAIVKQLVLLENEAAKAQQFLSFIQSHTCFDKQDHKAVYHFLELIEEEKKSLIIVLSNYSPQVQPLITMMTIAERRLTLLDSTNLITPGSTLHSTFVEKQRLLQDVIEQAASHVYGR